MIKAILNGKLFKQGLANPTFLQIIIWWEIRRIFFNMILFVTGLFTISACALLEYLFPRATENMQLWTDSPLIKIFLYAISANVLFTVGSISELFARKMFREKVVSFGSIAFALGLLFSIITTLSPVLIYVINIILKG